MSRRSHHTTMGNAEYGRIMRQQEQDDRFRETWNDMMEGLLLGSSVSLFLQGIKVGLESRQPSGRPMYFLLRRWYRFHEARVCLRIVSELFKTYIRYGAESDFGSDDLAKRQF